MQNRLKHLESLVKGVMSTQEQNVGSDSTGTLQATPSPPVDLKFPANPEIYDAYNGQRTSVHGQSNSSGQVVLGSKESTYVGATHWAAVLDDVRLLPFHLVVYLLLMMCRLKR